MPTYTHIEVDANDNTPMSANLVFKNLNDPIRVEKLHIFEGGDQITLCAVTGWSSDSSNPATGAYAVQVEDSGAGVAWLVYGGDQGIRLKPASSDKEWNIGDSNQWGETHLVLADAADIVPAAIS